MYSKFHNFFLSPYLMTDMFFFYFVFCKIRHEMLLCSISLTMYDEVVMVNYNSFSVTGTCHWICENILSGSAFCAI